MLSSYKGMQRHVAPFDTVILAGGVGSRLRSVVSDRPKCLALIHGRPFLSYLLSQLEGAGVRDAIISTGYMAEMVQETLGNQQGEITLQYSRELSALGTGGGARQALSVAQRDYLLIINGDSYFHFDWNDFLNWVDPSEMNLGMVLAWIEDGRRYGQVQVDDNGHVLAFLEKGQVAEPGWINAGIYILKRSVLESFSEGQPFSLEKELFPNQIGKGFRAKGYRGKFIDIGTPESYKAAEDFFLK